MKKILFVIFCVLATLSASAQLTSKVIGHFYDPFKNKEKSAPAIWDDVVSSDGYRRVFSSFRVLEINDGVIFVGVNAVKLLGVTNYNLCFFYDKRTDLDIKKGSPFLIKLGNDSIVDLTVGYSYSYSPEVRRALYTVVTMYSGYFEIPITDDFVSSLSYGIRKVRYERRGQANDIQLKKDKVSAFLQNCYSLVKDKVKEEKNFSDGF